MNRSVLVGFGFLIAFGTAVPAGAQELDALAIGKPYALAGTRGRILALAISPDGKTLASGGYDQLEDESGHFALRLWDLATRRQSRVIQVEGEGIEAIAFNANGSLVAVGCNNGSVSCWNATSGNPVTLQRGQVFAPHERSVDAVAISPDKGRVATGCYSGKIRIWYAGNARKAPTELSGHAQAVTCLAFANEGQHLVSGGDDGKLRVWQVATGKAEQTIDASALAVDALVVSDQD